MQIDDRKIFRSYMSPLSCAEGLEPIPFLQAALMNYRWPQTVLDGSLPQFFFPYWKSYNTLHVRVNRCIKHKPQNTTFTIPTFDLSRLFLNNHGHGFITATRK